MHARVGSDDVIVREHVAVPEFFGGGRVRADRHGIGTDLGLREDDSDVHGATLSTGLPVNPSFLSTGLPGPADRNFRNATCLSLPRERLQLGDQAALISAYPGETA